VPTVTRPAFGRQQAFDFAARSVVWGLSLFGLMRLSWFEAHALLPLTRLQAQVATSAFGAPSASIDVTLACSAADAFALCAGAILAYPSRWALRLGGLVGATLLILGLNTIRIGTLGRAAGSAQWFHALHIYVWPGALTVILAVYAFAWMRFTDERGTRVSADALPQWTVQLTTRFAVLTVVLLAVYIAASPIYLGSSDVLAVAVFVARAAAWVLHHLGVEASATANMLSTPRGGFVVTQECISSPLIPVYLAAIGAYSRTWRWGALAFLATVPLFIALGIARLLVVALPAVLVGSPMFLIHAFFQLLLAVVVVFVAAVWVHGVGVTAWRRALVGMTLGLACVYLLGLPYADLLTWTFAANAPLPDPQGAIALLPPFQVGLYVALFVAASAILKWRPFVIGLALLGLSQVAALAMLHIVASHALTPHVRDVRAWALGIPLLLVGWMVAHDRPHH
jgi:exosortase/archaeosortase family protein